MFELKRLSDEAILRHWKKPYAIACSTNRLRPRVFVTMCSKSIHWTTIQLSLRRLGAHPRFLGETSGRGSPPPVAPSGFNTQVP